MRLCVIIDAWEPIWGGGQTHVWEICRRLVQKYGVSVDIFTRALTSNSGKAVSGNETHCKGNLRIFRIGPPAEFFSLPARILWLKNVVTTISREHRNLSYDILHAHAYVSAIPLRILATFLRRPAVFTVHGSNNLDLRPYSIPGITERLLLTGIPFDAVISVTRHFLKYPNISKRIRVIPNGVDTNAFDSTQGPRKNNSKFTLLWVGRFERIKGIDILLRAMVDLIKQKPALQLLLVGYGYEKKTLIRLRDKLELQAHVRFIDKLESSDLIKLYKSADLYILPSLSEGHSVTLLEAWAARLPVVATRVGDNDRIISHGANGYLVTPGDVNSLSQVILKAVNNPKLADLGFAGYHLVKHKYTWDETTRRTYLLYETLLKSIKVKT